MYIVIKKNVIKYTHIPGEYLCVFVHVEYGYNKSKVYRVKKKNMWIVKICFV